MHRKEVLKNFGRKFLVGKLPDSEYQNKNDENKIIPYSESSYFLGNYKSPYYTEKHKDFRNRIRNYINENIRPEIDNLEKQGNYPSK